MSGYQPPTSQTQGSQSQSQVTGAQIQDDKDSTRMNYQCGDCGSIETYRVRSATRCPTCGGRVLYKLRTKRWVSLSSPFFGDGREGGRNGRWDGISLTSR